MIMTFTVICYKVYIKRFQGRWEELNELAVWPLFFINNKIVWENMAAGFSEKQRYFLKKAFNLYFVGDLLI